MTVIGFNFTKISGSNDGSAKGDINITSVPTIENVEKHDLTSLGISEAVSVNFKFVTSFEPKVGELVFEGEILYQVDDAKKIAKQWKDGNKVDEKIALDILNTIFRRCLSKAVDLADTLRLPPPIRFPVVTTEKPKISGN